MIEFIIAIITGKFHRCYFCGYPTRHYMPTSMVKLYDDKKMTHCHRRCYLHSLEAKDTHKTY